LIAALKALRHPKAGTEARTHSMHDAATEEYSGHDSKAQYFWVWGALLVLTAIEVVLGYKQICSPVRMLEVLLVLSIIKSALIIAYFMHLKFERAIMRWMLVISVSACFVIMYFFFFPDAGRVLRLGVH
jgi:cytochrome c oxidase subunit IV